MSIPIKLIRRFSEHATDLRSNEGSVTAFKHFPSRQEGVGRKARRLFEELGLFQSPKYPPWRIAAYRPAQNAIALLAIAYLLFVAGRPVRSSTGKSLSAQLVDMLYLWIRLRVDPPTYFAQELYDPDRLKLTDGFLTRFETKNGIFAILNRSRRSPFYKNELGDKAFFADFCASRGIPHASTLAEISPDDSEWRVHPEDVNYDIFCKPRRGLGAKGTIVFRKSSSGSFIDATGVEHSIESLETALRRTGKAMLVQRKLSNHHDIADMARDSLLTVRVITCRNELDQPEVCLAMLRLLAVLESDRSDLPDGEYGSPIQLETGVLGALAGDCMKSSPFRSDVHPATKRVVAGRVLPHWQAVKSLALQLHATLPHRIFVGWDIAVTPDGPVVLEGNSSFDVMFLQRVHRLPASDTRFGELLSFHLDEIASLRR